MVLNTWLIIIASYLPIIGWAAAPIPNTGNLWSMSVAGGGSCSNTFIDFYQNLQTFDKKMQDFSVPSSQRVSLFGSLNNGKPDFCVNTYGVAENTPSKMMPAYETQNSKMSTQMTAVIQAFANARPAQRCELALPVFRFFLEDWPSTVLSASEYQSEFHHPIQNLDGKGSMLSGPASPAEMQTKLSQMSTKMKSGDQLVLNLKDHGILLDSSIPRAFWKKLGVNYTGKPTWLFGLGTEKETLSVDQLNKYIQPLLDRGVVVHLDVDACYSGGFLQLSNFHHSSVCVTSTTDATHVTSEGDNTFIQDNGSQLKSSACAMAKRRDSNRPMTSLDWIVSQWELKQHAALASTSQLPCHASENDFENIDDTLTQLKDQISGKSMRADLLALFQSDYIDSYRNCGPDPVPSALPQIEDTLGKAKSCLNSPAAHLTPVEKYIIGEEIDEEDNQGDITPPDPHYATQQIARQLNFLQHADEAALKSYKAAICCLDYDPKTRSNPAICNN